MLDRFHIIIIIIIVFQKHPMFFCKLEFLTVKTLDYEDVRTLGENF